MEKTSQLSPIEYLSECFTYSPLTGDLFWKVRPRSHFKSQRGWLVFNSNYAGTVAGTKCFKKDGRPAHIRIGISNSSGKAKRIVAHRIIYALMGVEIPAGMEIDHRNLDPFLNAWENLRIATMGQNRANKRVARTKKSGLPKGVSPLKYGKFTASMKHDGRSVYIGSYDTPEAAHAAYCAKATELHGEFARHN